MAEIVISIASKVAEYLVGPISQRATYLFCFNQFIEDVEKSKQELEVKLVDMKRRKEEANRKTEEIMSSVKKWLDNVDAVLEEVQKLQQELQRGGHKCFNVSLKYSLAKQMKYMTKQMIELKNNSNFEPFSFVTQLPGITYFSSKDFVDFNSRKSTYSHLLEGIKDGKNKMIGLYGMGGSGKTTLAKEVGKKVDELKLFDKVVMAVVSKPPNVLNIQQEIAEQMGLNIQETTQFPRAQRLSSGLKNKKILIILDDVWTKLNLEEIGIPLNEGCWVLLTTRLHDVCVSLDCDCIIELPLLTEEEAWDLFKMRANMTNVSMNEFDRIGRKIVEECKGLPIAIVTVGSTLKRKSLQVWKSTLRRLQHPPQLDIEDNLNTPYAVLEVSYDNLSSPLAKSLFLLCSMFLEDHEIHVEDLIRFGRGTLKLGDNNYTMDDTRNEILATIEKLLDSGLLMHTSHKAYVKLHDVVRDVALWIGKKRGQEVLVHNHAVSTILVNSHQSLRDAKALSLWNLDKNFRLSNQLCCPRIEILLHHPQGFIEDFGGMEALKVLALICCSFTWKEYGVNTKCPISRSILSLTNLQTLCFRGQELGDISFLGELKRLEILDLRSSQFDELPARVVDMRKLKLLDIYGCSIKKSPIEVIGRCDQLEELYFWDYKSAIPENFSLSRLKRYVIYDSTCSFGRYHFLENLMTRYPFLEYFESCVEALRAICIQGMKVYALGSSMKDLVLRADCLWLQNCMWDYQDINFKIKHLGISSCCQERRFIIDSLQAEQVFCHLITLKLEKMYSLQQVFRDSSFNYSLPMLQELHIKRCPELRTCLFPHATITSLPKLRKLCVYECDKVKWLISFSLVSHCPSLEEMSVISCYEFERLVGGGSDEEAAHGDLQLFLKLKKLLLSNLPKLREIVGGGFEYKQEFLHDEQEYTQHLHESEIGSVMNSELCSIQLYGLLELEYIWKVPTQMVSLHRLETVSVSECPRLKNIFTLAAVTSLPELSYLSVENCEEWEGIFCEQSLKNLSSSVNVCFPKLKDIVVRRCNKMKWLFSYSQASHCPSLERLNIGFCDELEGVVKGCEGEVGYHEKLFPKMKGLSLRFLPKLREIHPGYEFNHGSEFWDCPLLKYKASSGTSKSINHFLQPNATVQDSEIASSLSIRCKGGRHPV